MRLIWIRRLTGAAALSLVAAAAAGSTAAGGDDAPAAAAETVIAADAKHLLSLFDLAKTKKKLEGRMKATAMLIAATAQDNLDGKDGDKMAAVREQALKVAAAIAKKDVAGAKAAAEGLADVKADAKADKKPMKLAEMHKFDLHELMDLFAGAAGGGMNLEKDIKAASKSGVTDAKAAELIGRRVSTIADYTVKLPPEFGGGGKTPANWEKWTKEMKKQATDVVAEAGKGGKADLAKLKKTFLNLDRSCSDCHGAFRDN